MTKLSDTVVIFDLDGTLIDSAPDLTAALNRALLREGLDEIDESKVKALVGEGARALLEKGFALQGKCFPAGRRGDDIVAGYIDDYQRRLSERSAPFPKVRETLERLKARGAALAVCTNKLECLAEPVLADFQLRQYFQMVVAADTFEEKKPSPLPLVNIVEETRRPRAVLIGDTYTDLAAADAAHMPCLIARFGYGQHDRRLSEAAHFDSFEQLPALIGGLWSEA
ncbi:HAD-IA family hydrolase [Parvularcula maris]|uniref:phosphoglycolate phosphatase n=1 Tax=Parvularcula maris TaxID=2965077 RepID=A0A9X2L7T3_9PROT|nr:HAD-IA family hydrolase [Parvularcula maris]MCQ8184617.1 HAD-IA family hydrolase [Parvularcula maris]